jgi:uncharacterized protein (DUF4415 family)
MNGDNTKGMHDDYEMREEYNFSRGVRGRFYQPKKRATTIRLDDDLILFFKKKASEQKIGYQTLVNAALREYVHHHATESE